jgi:hypothetical protein
MRHSPSRNLTLVQAGIFADIETWRERSTARRFLD